MSDSPARTEPANDNGSERRRAKACPICGRPAVTATAPFCSARCYDVDLHRWLGGVYRVPAEVGHDPDDLEGEGG